jgi:hypothetical protein
MLHSCHCTPYQGCISRTPLSGQGHIVVAPHIHVVCRMCDHILALDPTHDPILGVPPGRFAPAK